MRKLAALVGLAAFAPTLAMAQPAYSPGQQGTVGTVVSATCQSQTPACRVLLPSAQPVRGTASSLDISASKLVAAGQHTVATVCVITAGSAAGTLNDSATTGAAATANEIYAIPNAVGCVALDWPVTNGIVVVPGTGQAVSVSYN